MAKESVDVMINGGKATAAPPLGPALGPLGVNIGQVVGEINKKTADYAGMQVPVKVTVDTDDKSFEISIGTPPASALIKKEAGIKSGAANPKTDKVADLAIEQVIKVSKMKADALLGKDPIQRAKEICGTCDSMGVMIEGMKGRDAIAAINNGKFVNRINLGKTELTEEEKKELDEERVKLQGEVKEHHDTFVTKAKTILDLNKGKENKTIRKAMTDGGIPMDIVNEVCPEEKTEK